MAKLNKKDIDQIQTSYRSIGLIADVLASIFYDRLLNARPNLNPLFTSGAAAQYRMLIYGLGQIIEALGNREKESQVFEYLRQSHSKFDLEPDDYRSAHAEFLFTLKKGFGPRFSGPLAESWIKFGDYLFAQLMG